MKNKSSKMAAVPGMIGAVIAGVLGWVFNFGFNRLVFTIFGIPFVMLAAVIVIDLIAAKYHGLSKLLTAANIVFNLSYVFTNVFLPDGMLDPPGNEGAASESYMLFKLIHNSDLYETFMTVALVFFGCFVITLIFQIIWMIVLKRNLKKAAQ